MTRPVSRARAGKTSRVRHECASVLNVPVVWDGRTLGTMNLLREAGFYDEGDVPVGQIFAALATPALLELARG